MKIKITIDKKIAEAVLYDNPTAKDFASLLPLTLSMEDYNKTEKISQLSKKLSDENAPNGFKPFIGDITYYEPWGNLALFYKDFSYANGLISIGKIISGIENFEGKNNATVTFEAI